jgi:HSP20 family molecular chaperone IbpA
MSVTVVRGASTAPPSRTARSRRSGSLALPEGDAEGDIKATCQNGILEVRLPVTEAKPATKVPVTQG